MKKRILTMLLAVVVVVSLSGCSRGDTQKLVGKWYCEVGVEDTIMEEVFEELGDNAEYFSIEKLYFPVCFEFKEDSTAYVYVEENGFKKMVDDYAEVLVDGFGRYLVDMIYEETGMKVAQDEIWAYAGISEQEARDELAAEFQSGMKEIAGFYEAGKYKAENGRLYLSDDLDSEFDPAEYLAYSLDDDEFSIIGAVGKGEWEGGYPLVFEKVG